MQQELVEKNPILKLSFDFALQVMEYCEILEEKRKYIIARQLLRAATSIGANAMEAQNAESRADFIHKMKIAAKEADETQFVGRGQGAGIGKHLGEGHRGEESVTKAAHRQ